MDSFLPRWWGCSRSSSDNVMYSKLEISKLELLSADRILRLFRRIGVLNLARCLVQQLGNERGGCGNGSSLRWCVLLISILFGVPAAGFELRGKVIKEWSRKSHKCMGSEIKIVCQIESCARSSFYDKIFVVPSPLKVKDFFIWITFLIVKSFDYNCEIFYFS